ncbi:MAG: CPBP family intramembrane glutamic endopeptidase [Sphaerochaetaceae bacterium]|jgi:membrane protease YdiL (CAAX protease family)
MKTKKQISIFVGLSCAIAWSVFALIPLLHLSYGTGSSVIILAAMMFAPAASNILTRLITKEGFKNLYLKPQFKGKIKLYVASFFGPSLLLLFSGALYFLLIPTAFDPDLTQIKALLALQGPKNMGIPSFLLIAVAQIVVIGPVVNLIPTLGEELGWRGYLLPKLRLITSDRKAFIISGVIWGVWHFPAIILGHNYGTSYVLYPYLGIIAMILFCIVLGIIEGYVTIKTGNVICAAMIHSTVNAGAALPLLLAKEGYNTLLGPAITGLVGGLPFIVLALFLFWKSGTQSEKETVLTSGSAL